MYDITKHTKLRTVRAYEGGRLAEDAVGATVEQAGRFRKRISATSRDSGTWPHDEKANAPLRIELAARKIEQLTDLQSLKVTTYLRIAKT